MQPESTIDPLATPEAPPLAALSHYCGCALPIAVERAERHGAAERICTRCGRPIAVRWRRW